MNAITNISPQQLRQAAAVQERVQQLQAELEHILGLAISTEHVLVTEKRRLSPQARAKIQDAQLRRWAKQRKSGRAVSRSVKRKISAKARAKIAAAVKARWAAAKKAGRTAI